MPSSNKMPIKWHEGNVSNMIGSYMGKLKEKIRLEDDIERLDNDIILYESQIALAKKMNKDAFDRERFGIKKKE